MISILIVFTMCLLCNKAQPKFDLLDEYMNNYQYK